MPGTPKQFNSHRFPDATRQPRHLDRLRKEGAKDRQEVYDKLTLEQKIDRLPAEPHAAKQRARLLALLEKRKQPKQEAAITPGELNVIVADTSPKQRKPKKYMKGAKS